MPANTQLLSNVHTRLRALQSELRGRRRSEQSDPQRDAFNEARDAGEEAGRVQGVEVLNVLDDSDQYRLACVHQALRRLEAGLYGQCAHCGGPIDKRRLEAIPEAITCIECADMT
jgi:DnaK suppressor protein